MGDRIAWPQVISQARDIVLGYGSLGCTLRQLWYRLFRASVYRRLSAQVAAARRAGDFPDLIDGTRTVHLPPAWPDAELFLTSMTERLFRLDRTRDQPVALYLARGAGRAGRALTGIAACRAAPALRPHVGVRPLAASD